MLKFSANLGFLFSQEVSGLVDRINQAGTAGFKGVEIPYPYEVNPPVLASVKESNGLEVVLLNAWPGDLSAGELGISIFPGRREEFREKLELSITYLKALDCHRLHITSGVTSTSAAADGADDAELEETYVTNLRYAAERLEREGVTALIEAICCRAKPRYWLSDPLKAAHIISRVSHPNLRLMLDVFHAQIAGGDLSRRIEDWAPIIGHVQIAQVPNRDEPDSTGEINYRYILQHLTDCGYSGWVGLEYRPRGATVDGLKWLTDWGYWS